MRIDKSHLGWMLCTLVALLLSTLLFAVYARAEPGGPRGGSWQGMLFGIAGSAMMLFCGLLSLRKKLPRLPIGSAQLWLKAHIWLGLLSVPLILFHAGFRWGGLLEQVLLGVFAAVIVSGLVGLAFQHVLPGVMKDRVPRESMFEQAPRVCQALQRTADEQVVARCGNLFAPPAGGAAAGEEGAELERQTLREFYVTTVRPFLGAGSPAASPLKTPAQAAVVFSEVRQALPKRLHDVLAQLDSMCGERRELARQVRLYRWLHGWLFLHVPLSLALLVLAVAHAIAAVYY